MGSISSYVNGFKKPQMHTLKKTPASYPTQKQKWAPTPRPAGSEAYNTATYATDWDCSSYSDACSYDSGSSGGDSGCGSD